MYVTAVTPFLVDPGTGKNWLFVKVDTRYFVNFEARAQDVATASFQVDHGYIALPTTPGLGIELRQEVLARYPYREFPLRGLPTFHDEGP